MGIKKRIYSLKQKGQGLLEYIILTSMVGIFCLLAIKQYGQVLERRIVALKASVVKNMSLD